MSNALRKIVRRTKKNYNPTCRRCKARMIMTDDGWACPKCGRVRPFSPGGRYERRE